MSLEAGQRRLLVLSSNDQSQSAYEDCLSYALASTKDLNCLNLSNPKRANDYLGQEFDAVIFNTFEVFDPNALGAIVGTIKAGGYLILLKANNWPEESFFLKRFQSLLEKTEQVEFVDVTRHEPIVFTKPQQKEVTSLFASDDQQAAVEAVEKVVKGHRRRPLVITADRGRGKSASLGIASAQLYDEGVKNIIVCAPSKKTAEVIFKTALKTNPESQIQFFSPDELHQQKPKVDLLLIDEAGAIPLTLLEDFAKHYSRLVFATTLHGYEGSGRGFTLKFFNILDNVAPDWNHLKLKTPIRYQENDPLENFIFEALLLNIEPVEVETSSEIKPENYTVEEVSKEELIADEPLLHEVFGLLVNAHYQTKPSDLKLMLDDASMRTIILKNDQNNVIAVALLVQEGNLDGALATKIFQGERRVKGHLVAQALSANAGIEMAPCLSGERISRIAVHPQLQGKGIGSYLLKKLVDSSKADYVSTSFGATEELINFWKEADFIPVYLGMKRDASSGAHSVIMLKVVTEEGQTLTNNARNRFVKHMPHLLSEPFKSLEAELIVSLMKDSADESAFQLSNNEKQELSAFTENSRGYENTLYPLWVISCNSLISGSVNLSKPEVRIIVSKILQKHTWNEVVKLNQFDGKKEAIFTLRQAISKLLSEK